MHKVLLTLLVIISTSFIAYSQKVNTDSLLFEISKPIEDTHRVIAYRMLAGTVLSSNPVKAVGYGRSGVALGKKIGFDKGVAGCYLNISAAYSSAGKPDSALIYIDTALTWSKKVGEPARIALAFLNKADYNRQLQFFKQALRDCDSSLVYATKANKEETKGRVYQTIGSVYYMQDNFPQSKIYYERGLELYRKAGNKKMMAISLSNLGNVYKHMKEYENAVASFQNAISMGDSAGDLNNMAMYYGNLADTWYEKGDLPKAEANAMRSLELAREQENDAQIAISQGVLGNIFLKGGKINEAIRSASESYKLATENEITETRQLAADELSEAFSRSGNYKEAHAYLQVSKLLSDSLARQKFDEELASMQTSFEVNEKDKEIQLLNKDRQLQEQKLRDQRLLLIAAIAIALLAIFGIGLAINRYRLRHRMKELELRNRIAADLHDEVGSSLSSIHMLSQMAAQPGHEETHKDILSRMSNNAKETMDKMGDIVWMIKPGETDNSLKQRMERFAYEICSSRSIETIVNLDELERLKLTMEQRKNLYLVFKEALNNAVKYSGTEKIEITAQVHAKQLDLLIKDQGKGFIMETTGRGNGMDNMKHRAKELNGKLEIKSEIGKGSIIKLSMPV